MVTEVHTMKKGESFADRYPGYGYDKPQAAVTPEYAKKNPTQTAPVQGGGGGSSTNTSTNQGVSIGNRNPLTGKIEGGTQYNPDGSTITFSPSGQGTSYSGGGSGQPMTITTVQQLTKSSSNMFTPSYSNIESNSLNKQVKESYDNQIKFGYVPEAKGFAGAGKDIVNFGGSLIGGIGKGINKLNYNVEYQRNLLSTQEARGKVNPLIYNIKGIGLGIASTGIGLIRTVQHPIKSAKGTFSSIINYRQTGEQIGNILKSEPGYATGIVIGTYLTGKGTEFALTKGVTTGVDIYRVKGLTEVKVTDVVAPEFFKGQKYPQIAKGEKAGQLLKEFKGAGYTASPKPLSANKGVLSGSSELPGLYQAPKVSATFLRVTGEEKKAFSLNPFGTLRPTVSRVKPTVYELAPGVEFGSPVNTKNLPKIKEFFIDGAEKGKAYIPFIKTEKEAVIPYGTQLEKLETKSYFKFEGRRIPIEEFKTIKGESSILDSNIKSINEVSYSGYKSIGSKSYTSPLSISSSLGLSKLPSKYKSVNYSSSEYIIGYSNPKLISSGNKTYSNSLSNFGSSSVVSSGGDLVSGGSYGLYSKGISGGVYNKGSSGLSSKGFIKPTEFIIPEIDRLFKKRIKKRKGIKFKTKIAPSFTAEVFNLRGKLPKSGKFGITPFQLRRIPKSKINYMNIKF